MITNIDSLQFNIIYSSRKSIAIELKIDSIIVRAPKGMLRRDINAFLNEKRPWIEKNLAKIQERKNTLKHLHTFEAEEIRELTKVYGKVYVSLPNKAIQYRFFSDAEREGFTFANMEKPTSGECYHLMGVKKDKTLTYVSGWASNMYYFQNKRKVVTVNYERYIEGYEDYLVKFE